MKRFTVEEWRGVGGDGIWKEWREWENQRWSRGLRGGDDLLGCVCSQSPPLWHNRTMYSKGFKYLYPDLMFLATHTHVYTRAWKGWMLNCLPWITEVSSPTFLFSPLVVLHRCRCRCLGLLVQCGAAEPLIKMAGANRIVSQSSTHPGSLSNVLSNHCDGQLGLCAVTINIL